MINYMEISSEKGMECISDFLLDWKTAKSDKKEKDYDFSDLGWESKSIGYDFFSDPLISLKDSD